MSDLIDKKKLTDRVRELFLNEVNRTSVSGYNFKEDTDKRFHDGRTDLCAQLIKEINQGSFDYEKSTHNNDTDIRLVLEGMAEGTGTTNIRKALEEGFYDKEGYHKSENLRLTVGGIYDTSNKKNYPFEEYSVSWSVEDLFK